MKPISRRSLGMLVLPPVLAVVAACGSSSHPTSLGSSATSSATSIKSTIVIGNVGNYSNSGQFGPQYLQAAHGLQAWASFTNAHGGLNGHPVKIVVKDDANNVSTSLRAVETMITSDHVVAIAAVPASGTDNAWANYVKAQKVPVIGGISTDPNWDGNPYMLSLNADAVAFVTGQFAAAKGQGTTVGVFSCAELTACKSGIPLFAGVTAKLGLKYAGTQLVAASATDYTAQCQALKNAGADIVVPELDGPTAKRVLDACALQGFTPKSILPASLIDTALLNDPVFNGATGITTSPLWFGSLPQFEQDFDATYKSLFPSEVPNGFSTLGWQAGEVIGTALKTAPDTVTSQTVVDALNAQPANSTFGGWTPPISFPAGKSTAVSSCVWYVGIENKALTAPRGYNPVCAAG
jgi:branched-chain amino acid transport system substrate-binding protein